jgi:chromosome segregation ATPase
VSFSEQQLTELQQQLETAISEKSHAAAELAAAAAAAADAQGQLAALRQQAVGRQQQLKEAADKVG